MALPEGLRVDCPRCGATLQAGSTGHSACPLVRARIVNSDGAECDRYGVLTGRRVNTAVNTSDVNKAVNSTGRAGDVNKLTVNSTGPATDVNSEDVNNQGRKAYMRAYMASRRKKAGD